MQTRYSFNRVHDTIKVYRKLMNAFAHPGKKENILEGIGDFGPDYQAFLALAVTLLDTEVSFCVNNDIVLADKISEITNCKQETLQSADYIFLPSALEDAQLECIFSNAKHGTFSDPHTSATLILSAPNEHYMKHAVSLLKKQQIEFPLGIDMVFILNDSQFVAVPRLIKEVV